MALNILTKEDLKKFKSELFDELRVMTIPKPAQETPKHKEWLRSHEVCKMLGISVSKLQYMRSNGHIRFTKVGSIIFYSYTEIQNMLKSGLENNG